MILVAVVKSAAMPTLTHVIPPSDARSVTGLTTIDNRLFVLRFPCNQRLEQYELSTYKLQGTLRVKSLSDDYARNGLTSCNVNSCLYVCDYGGDMVYRIDLLSNNKVYRWPVGDGPSGVSVNDSSNLLVTCHTTKKIQEYTSKGSLVREICFPFSETHWPMYTVQVDRDRFVVSRRGAVSDVIEIDPQGRRLVSYRDKLQSTTKHQFNEPHHFTVDGDGGCIFVADVNNNRILVLDRKSISAREFNPSAESGLKEPYCIYLDKSRGLLFVGEFKRLSGRILIFTNDWS
jgi:DNA-binding beta-propeller fold protein YncE